MKIPGTGVDGSARNIDEALATAAEVGYPVMVRSSYVLGGRAMRVVYDDDGLRRNFEEARSASGEHPVLIDQFLEDAVEFDVDAVCDGHDVPVGGIMQHIEEAGIHSGNSFAVLPPYKTTPEEIAGAGHSLYHHPVRRKGCRRRDSRAAPRFGFGDSPPGSSRLDHPTAIP